LTDNAGFWCTNFDLYGTGDLMLQFRGSVVTCDAGWLSALCEFSGHWIDRVHCRHPPTGILLDMDSSVRRTGSER
jgi:hypothetical protein